MVNLQILHDKDTKIDAKSINMLSEMKSMTDLNIYKCDSIQFDKVLQWPPNLQKLDARSTNITAREINMLSEMKSVVEIDISSCTNIQFDELLQWLLKLYAIYSKITAI